MMHMEPKKKTKLQIELEKYVAEVNPMRLVIGTDREYEHEVALFLERAGDSVDTEQLTEEMRQIFCEMFNLTQGDSVLEQYRKIVNEFLRLKTEHIER
jgi:hypothetical protein